MTEILCTSGTLEGEPRIEGTRLTVEQIIQELIHDNGIGFEELVENYPTLTEEGLEAAILHALRDPDLFQEITESYISRDNIDRNGDDSK